MLTGRLPFDGTNTGSLLSKIKSGRYLPLPSHVSRDAKDLIKRMLTVNPSKRITVSVDIIRYKEMSECRVMT